MERGRVHHMAVTTRMNPLVSLLSGFQATSSTSTQGYGRSSNTESATYGSSYGGGETKSYGRQHESSGRVSPCARRLTVSTRSLGYGRSEQTEPSSYGGESYGQSETYGRREETESSGNSQSACNPTSSPTNILPGYGQSTGGYGSSTYSRENDNESSGELSSLNGRVTETHLINSKVMAILVAANLEAMGSRKNTNLLAGITAREACPLLARLLIRALLTSHRRRLWRWWRRLWRIRQ